MNVSHTDNLAPLLEQADAALPAPRKRSLDANALLALAERNLRRRRIGRTAATAALVLVVVTLATREPPDETRATSTAPDLAALTASIDALHQRTEELAQRLSTTTPARYDILSAIDRPNTVGKRSLEQMRAELAVLESRHATSAVDNLEWEMEWSRSAALRLELAHQDSTANPSRAVDAYRQIASAYAGTRWANEARVALGEIAGP